MSELVLARGVVASSMRPVDVTNTSSNFGYKDFRRMLGSQVYLPKKKRGSNRMKPKNRKRKK